MTVELSKAEMAALRAHLEGRVDEMLASTRRLVETESPSGDVEGSRAVVELLAQSARTIETVTAVERIESPGYGEHLRVRAFGNGKLVTARYCSSATRTRCMRAARLRSARGAWRGIASMRRASST